MLYHTHRLLQLASDASERPKLGSSVKMAVTNGDDIPWTSSPLKRYCRDRSGYFVADSEFNFRTCASCYAYLFPEPPHLIADGMYLVQRHTFSENQDLTTDSSVTKARYLATNESISDINDDLTVSDATGGGVIADVNSDISRTIICDTLKGGDGCGRWVDCCQSAEQCCRDQLNVRSSASDDHQWTGQSPTCPITWDGYSCWSKTDAGVTASRTCPTFLPYVSLSGKSIAYSPIQISFVFSAANCTISKCRLKNSRETGCQRSNIV